VSRAIGQRAWLAAVCVWLAAVVAAGVARAADNQFVILSDMHRYPPEERQLTKLTDALLALRPAFVVTLGDMDTEWGEFGEQPIDGNLPQMFHRLVAAGIGLYPCMGNHDTGTEKTEFFCTHQPPINPEFDAKLNPATHDRWCRDHEYWYSWNRGGIHFVVLQTSGVEDINKMLAWAEDDLCRNASNPDHFPTLIFLHYASWIFCERGCHGALYELLTRCPENTVAAVFAGDSHKWHYYPAEANLGIPVYETTAATHWEIPYPEYIVATVGPRRITFEALDTRTGAPSLNGAFYYPIEGRFGSLAAGAVSTGVPSERVGEGFAHLTCVKI
jgi:hypothetical protein